MQIITGNLIELANEGRFTNIVHGCNCQSTMSSGVAKAIRTAFPRAYTADVELHMAATDRLGTVSSTKVEAVYTGDDFRVINAYTQLWYGRGGNRYVNYQAVRACFKYISLNYCGIGTITAYPLIGCGLGGGDWDVISSIIDEEMGDNIHYLVKLK